MSRTNGKPARARRHRVRAVAVGLFLLLAQLVAAAHSHAVPSRQVVAPAAQSTIAEAACGLCQFARHSTSAATIVLRCQHPHVVLERTVEPLLVVRSAPAFSLPPGRGPPASV